MQLCVSHQPCCICLEEGVPFANWRKGAAHVTSDPASLVLFLCFLLFERSRMKQGKEQGGTGKGFWWFTASFFTNFLHRPLSSVPLPHPVLTICLENTSRDKYVSQGSQRGKLTTEASPVCSASPTCVRVSSCSHPRAGWKTQSVTQILQLLRELSQCSDEL